MNRSEGLPPSYEEIMRGTGCPAVTSAPEKSGSKKSTSGHSVPSVSQVPVGQAPFTGSLNPPGGPPLPCFPPNQPVGGTPQTLMPMYAVPHAPTTVYITNPVLGPKPCTTTCPNCHQLVRTALSSNYSPTAHILCMVMCAMGMGCCSCIPYCMDEFQVIKHWCPQCSTYLGSYNP